MTKSSCELWGEMRGDGIPLVEKKRQKAPLNYHPPNYIKKIIINIS